MSAPCSCFTAVAAQGTWAEGGAGVETGVDGPAVMAGPALGSVFTVATKSESRETHESKVTHSMKLKVAKKIIIWVQK